MRTLMFILVLANLLFFAHGRGLFGRAENPDAQRLAQQVEPDKLVVVSRGTPPGDADAGTFGRLPDSHEAPAEKGKADKADKTDKAKPGEKANDKAADKPAEKSADKAVSDERKTCYAWADLSGLEADRLLGVVAGSKWSAFKSKRSAQDSGGPYWVYIPPLASKADAERKAGELRALGINEFFIVQETGANHFAISLGVFSTEAAANERLDKLKTQGVRSARVGPRNPPPLTVEVRGPAGQGEAFKQAVATALPGKTVAECGR